MQNSREDSVWRTLAVAFGDGLAFGVGMNLTQNAVRMAAGRGDAELQPLAERLAAIEQRIDRAKANGGLPSPASLDARITELASQFERQLTEAEVKVKIQLESLHSRDRALAQTFDAQMASLREQMVTLHREFAETVSRLVEEQIEAGVTARLEPLEEKLRAAIREEAVRASDLVSAELERRLEARDRNVLQLVLALGQTCLETAERMSPPATPASGGSSMAQTAITPVDAPERWPWMRRLPLVSSFIAVTGSLLLLHYL